MVGITSRYYIYDSAIYRRLKNIQARIKYEKSNIRQEVRKIESLKREIMDLLSELERELVIKDSYSVIEFMDDINERYGLDSNSETELGRLFFEITEDFVRCEILDDEENDEEKTYEELLSACSEAERKYLLCKGLLDKVRLAKFEYKMLKNKLSEIKKEYLRSTKPNIDKNENDSRLDDFCY